MGNEPIKILLVDDQNIMLDGLESLLKDDSDFQVVGRANNGAQAITQTESLSPDVVLMDISMPEMDGIEATRALKEKRKTRDVKILVLSMYALKDFVDELMEAGASGYVLKNTTREELREALLTVASGHRYLAKPVEAVMEQASRFKPRANGDGFHALTRREKEIIKLVVAEKSTQEIADELHLSPATVETHRKNIFHKLDIRNTAGLVKYAMERGWKS